MPAPTLPISSVYPLISRPSPVMVHYHTSLYHSYNSNFPTSSLRIGPGLKVLRLRQRFLPRLRIPWTISEISSTLFGPVQWPLPAVRTPLKSIHFPVHLRAPSTDSFKVRAVMFTASTPFLAASEFFSTSSAVSLDALLPLSPGAVLPATTAKPCLPPLPSQLHRSIERQYISLKSDIFNLAYYLCNLSRFFFTCPMDSIRAAIWHRRPPVHVPRKLQAG